MSPGDTGLYTITDSCDVAIETIQDFYSNYHSIRFVGDRLTIRMHTGPTDAQLATLNDRYAHLCSSGGIERTAPSRVERRDDDHLDLDRIALHHTRRGFSDLIAMIGDINSWV